MALGIALQDALTGWAHRPETIRVQRPRLAAMLAQVASQLGIPVLEDAELVELNVARRRLEHYVDRGR